MKESLNSLIPFELVITNTTFFFVLCGLLFWGAYIRIDFNQRFVLVTRAFFSERYFNQLLKVDKLSQHASSFFFNFNYLLNISFFLLNVLVLLNFKVDFHPTFYFLLFLILIFGVTKSLIKDFLSKLIFYFSFKDLKLNQSLFYQNSGVFLLFLNFIYVLFYRDFHHFILYIGVVFFLLMFIYKTFREIKLAIQNKISIFYIILYLCALEIIPMLVIYRFTLNY